MCEERKREMPTLEQIRQERILELVGWGQKVAVLSKPLPFDRLYTRAVELWPGRTRKTLRSYAESALLILKARPNS